MTEMRLDPFITFFQLQNVTFQRPPWDNNIIRRQPSAFGNNFAIGYRMYDVKVGSKILENKKWRSSEDVGSTAIVGLAATGHPLEDHRFSSCKDT